MTSLTLRSRARDFGLVVFDLQIAVTKFYATRSRGDLPKSLALAERIETFAAELVAGVEQSLRAPDFVGSSANQVVNPSHSSRDANV